MYDCNWKENGERYVMILTSVFALLGPRANDKVS